MAEEIVGDAYEKIFLNNPPKNQQSQNIIKRNLTDSEIKEETIFFSFLHELAHARMEKYIELPKKTHLNQLNAQRISVWQHDYFKKDISRNRYPFKKLLWTPRISVAEEFSYYGNVNVEDLIKCLLAGYTNELLLFKITHTDEDIKEYIKVFLIESDFNKIYNHSKEHKLDKNTIKKLLEETIEELKPLLPVDILYSYYLLYHQEDPDEKLLNVKYKNYHEDYKKMQNNIALRLEDVDTSDLHGYPNKHGYKNAFKRKQQKYHVDFEDPQNSFNPYNNRKDLDNLISKVQKIVSNPNHIMNSHLKIALEYALDEIKKSNSSINSPKTSVYQSIKNILKPYI